MASPFKTLLIAAGIALGAASLSPVAAQAGDRASLTIGNGGLTFHVGSPKRDDRYRRDRGFRSDGRWNRDRYRHRDFRRGERRATCSPQRALRMVERRGIRRAYVRRVGDRGIVIAGRKRGERIVVGFGHHRSCPVRFVRARSW